MRERAVSCLAARHTPQALPPLRYRPLIARLPSLEFSRSTDPRGSAAAPYHVRQPPLMDPRSKPIACARRRAGQCTGRDQAPEVPADVAKTARPTPDHPSGRDGKPRVIPLSRLRALLETAVAEWHNLRLADLQFWHRSEARLAFLWLPVSPWCCSSSGRSCAAGRPPSHRRAAILSRCRSRRILSDLRPARAVPPGLAVLLRRGGRSLQCARQPRWSRSPVRRICICRRSTSMRNAVHPAASLN